MKFRTLAALLAAVHTAPALAVDPPKSVSNALGTRVPVANLVVSVDVPNVAAVPGEKKTFTATLKGVPPQGKTVLIRIAPAGLQKSVPVDAQGKATAQFVLPDIAQGSYPIEGIWQGDAEHKGTVGSGKLTMIKAPTKIDMDFVYGTYKNEPGKYASFSAKVVRVHDGRILKKPITLTVNGATRVVPADEYHNTALPDATTWVVKVQFEGDAAYAASAGEHTYHKPKP